jgi:periplasmic protein TonB
MPPPVVDWPEERSGTGWIIPVAIVASLLLHIVMFRGLREVKVAPRDKGPIEIDYVRPAPPPEPEPVAEPEPPPPRPFLEPKLVKEDVVKPPPVLPASNQSTPLDDPPVDAKPVFGLTADSVSEAGDFAMQVGNTLMKAPETRTTDAADVKPYYQPEKAPFVPAKLVEVTSFPSVRKQIKPDYPPKLRAEGVEGTVIVEADINVDGDVVEARLKRATGTAFDEAALQAIRETKYNPARVGREAVPVRVSVPVQFRLR